MGNVVPDRFFWALPPPEDGEGEGGTGEGGSFDDGANGSSDGKGGAPRRVH
jgi:hydroxymethylpyrimidine/phosphomethylpyrimidine kinase